MARPCSSCHHPDRVGLDRALALGQETLRGLAKRYAVDRASLARHRDNHLSPALVKVAAERETAGALSAHERVEQLYTRAVAVLDAAEADGKASLTLAAVRELRSCAELLARLSGELNERPQVALVLTQSDEWQRFAAGLLDVLDGFPPELGQRVLAELQAATDSSPSDAGVARVGWADPAVPIPRGAAS